MSKLLMITKKLAMGTTRRHVETCTNKLTHARARTHAQRILHNAIMRASGTSILCLDRALPYLQANNFFLPLADASDGRIESGIKCKQHNM